jgi:hypothetical protein
MTMTIEEALQHHQDSLMALDGVVGVGISAREGEAVLLVMLDRPGSQVEGTIPDQLEGFRVEAEEIGEVSAF